MYGVIIALLPALVASLWFFGIGALIITLTSIAACVFFEWLIQKYLLKTTPSVSDGSAAVTGLLLAFNLPTNIPLGLIIIGAAVAIGIGKLSFGGLGNNPFNPALVGRVFLLISFPVQMTSWPVPITSRLHYIDAETAATPLSVIKEGVSSGQTIPELMSEIPSYINMFIGNIGGSAGEMAGIALILGGIYLLWKKIITWHIPVSVIGSVIIFTGILHLIDPSTYADPLFHVLAGGVLLGAFFMATDYVTSPMSRQGMLLYGVGIGVITVLIRVFGSYPEGVSFAILIMNAFTPLIDRYMKPKRFGEKVKTVRAQTSK
jgi:electron transport complex protein RnfD